MSQSQSRCSNQSDLIHSHLWRQAEEETLFLLRKYKLSPTEVIEQYTGKRPQQADIKEAIDAIYSFNINQATKNGFVAY